ncbi:hypothetical protein ACXYL9_02305 [Qipengyuania sp. CAU 1752]
MSQDKDSNVSREDRLAAKLRENLRRRKVQARELDGNAGESGESGVSKPVGRG